MTEEIWRPVVGYEGLYEVSSYGRVRSLDKYDSRNRFRKGRILTLYTETGGYLRAHLSSNGKAKWFFVHRLVSIAFIHNPDNLPEVNHIDEDKTNNRVDNLEFCNRKYNINFGSRTDRMRDTKIKNGTYTGLSREEYMKKWNQENKEYHKKWNQENKERIRDYKKQYYQEHKNEYNERQKEYSQKNKDKIRDYHHQYYLKKKAGL